MLGVHQVARVASRREWTFVGGGKHEHMSRESELMYMHKTVFGGAFIWKTVVPYTYPTTGEKKNWGRRVWLHGQRRVRGDEARASGEMDEAS